MDSSSSPAAGVDAGRLARLRAEISRSGCGAGLFYDPINIRYATGTSNMQVYTLHNPCRYVFVPADGPVVLFEFKGCEHLSVGHHCVDEVRSAVSWYDFVSGDRVAEFSQLWADEIADLVRCYGSELAADRLDPIGATALTDRGIHIHDGQRIANRARAVKTDDEIVAIRRAVAASDAAIEDLRGAVGPGRTEREVWAELHRSNIARGGEWLETRLLTSGPRTNPWYQECSDKVLESGELLAFDTDLIGVDGYSVDISRTWLIGDAAPTDGQRRLHDAACEQLMGNIELCRVGASFAEVSSAAIQPPTELQSVTNAAILHGIGLCNEYPLVLNRQNFVASGYDGEIQAGMVLCVEALIAPPGGVEAVKLEEQVLVTEDGPEVLSTSPLGLTA